MGSRVRPLFLVTAVLTFSLSLSQEASKGLEYYNLVQQFNVAAANGDHNAAAELASKALDINGRDGDLWNAYGQELMRLSKYEQAIAAFVRAKEVGAFYPKFEAVVAFNIASCSARLDRMDEALKWLTESFEKGHRDLKIFGNSEFAPLKGDPRYDEMLANRDVSVMSRNEGLAFDLWYMDRELRRIHFDPFAVVPRTTLDKELQSIRDAIPTMTDEQFYARCRQYVAMIGDGHIALRVNQWTAPDARQLPVRFTSFSDGVFVSGASEEFSQLVGMKLVALNRHEQSKLWTDFSSLVSKDNSQDDAAQIPALYTYASLLKGMGVATGDTVALTLRAPDGAVTSITIPFEQNATVRMAWQGLSELPLYLQHTDKAYWYTYIEDEKTVYMQYNAVRNDTEPLSSFMDRLAKDLVGKDVDKFVVDVRFNGGGNSFLNASIQRALMQDKNINRRGHLFIITGRNTFSAAQNFTTDFMRDANAIFVGEPTGSRPNFVGESNPIVLPFTKMRMTVSDLYWQRSWPMDHRMWIPPDIPTEMSSKMYFEGRDPAMEAILAFKSPGD